MPLPQPLPLPRPAPPSYFHPALISGLRDRVDWGPCGDGLHQAVLVTKISQEGALLPSKSPTCSPDSGNRAGRLQDPLPREFQDCHPQPAGLCRTQRPQAHPRPRCPPPQASAAWTGWGVQGAPPSVPTRPLPPAPAARTHSPGHWGSQRQRGLEPGSAVTNRLVHGRPW